MAKNKTVSKNSLSQNKAKLLPLSVPAVPKLAHLTSRLLAGVAAIPVSFFASSMAHAATVNETDIGDGTSGFETGRDTTGDTIVNSIMSGSYYNQILSGEGNVVVNFGGEGLNTNAWTLQAVNTYTGTTDIQSGAILQAGVDNIIAQSIGVTLDGIFNSAGNSQTLNNLSGSGEYLFNEGISSGSSSTLTLNNTSSTIWSGQIKNGGEGAITGNVVFQGTSGSVLTIGAVQLHTGNTQIDDGATVAAGVANIFADSSDVTVNGTFRMDGYNQTLTNLAGNGSVEIGGSATLTVNIEDAQGWSGVVSNGGEGAGNLIVSGDDTWTVNTQQTYTGTTQIASGATVQAGANNIFSNSVGATVDGIFNADGYDQTLNNLGGEGYINLSGAGTDSATLTIHQTSDTTWSGVIANGGEGAASNVAITGTNELTVSQAQTYTGTTNIGSGSTLKAGTTNIIDDSRAVTVNGSFNANGYAQQLSDLTGTGTISLGAGCCSSGSLVVNVLNNTSWGGNIIDGVDSDPGSVTIQNGGEGSPVWTVNSQQGYTGDTSIASGATVKAGTADIIENSRDVRLNGAFDGNGYDQTLTNLNGSGTYSINGSSGSSSSATLTVKVVDNVTWAGVISNGGEGASAGNVIVSNGGEGGVWTVGAQQTYTGTTQINSGANVKAHHFNIISESSAVTIDGRFDADDYDQLLNNLGGEGQILLGQSGSGGATLTLNSSQNTTWAGVISENSSSDPSNVVIDGDGSHTLTIGAEQTYTGTTEITEDGIVRAAADDIFAHSHGVTVDGEFNADGYDQTFIDLAGSGSIVLSNNSTGGTLTVQLDHNTSWNGVISNGGEGAAAGSVILSNGGEGSYTWTVNEAQTYTGNTSIDDGITLRAGTENVIADSNRVTVSGVFDGNGYNQTLNDLGGEGEVFIGGSGSTGATLTLHSDSGSSWNGVISNGGEGAPAGNVVFTDGGDHEAIIIGAHQEYTGTTNIQSGAVVNAAATNILSASSAVTINGTLNANNYDQYLTDLTGAGNINMGTGELTLNGVHDTTFSGVISGSQSILFTGNFVTRLTGANTNTGNATVNTGTTLTVDGSIDNDLLTVSDGATLKGSGQINGNVVNNGTVAPGNSPGTLNIVGNYSGVGSLQQEITGSNTSGNFDLLEITGTADLSSQTVDYTPLAPAPASRYTRGTQYTYLTAGGGLGGTQFSNAAENSVITADSGASGTSIASSPAPALAIRTNYTANDVTATIVRSQFFARSALTPNQASAGNALDSLQLTATTGSDIDTILNEIDGLSTSGQIASSLESLAGSLNAELQTAAFDLQHRFDGAVGKRIGGDCNQMGASKKLAKPGSAAWACAYGDVGGIDADANRQKVSNRSYGIATGYEFTPSESNLVRIGLGYAQQHLKQDNLSNNATQSSFQLGAYGQHYLGKSGLYLGAGLAGAYNSADTTRYVNVGGINRVAEGDANGYNTAVSALVGYEHHVGDVRIEPVAGLEYIYTHQNSFTETGAGAANLTVKDQSNQTLRSSIGAQVSTSVKLCDMTIVPEGRAAFIYDSLDVAPTIDQSIAGSNFSVKGANPGRAGVQGGAGVTLNVNENMAVFVDYTGTVKEDATNNSLMGGLKYKW